MRNIYNLIFCDFLLFVCNLFNLMAFVLFNFFAHNFLSTLVWLIFFIIICLLIFLTPSFFLLWDYTITINGNVINIFEMWSALFRTRCTYFWFLMKSVNIIFHASVCGKCFLYLRIEYLRDIFHMADCTLVCCTLPWWQLQRRWVTRALE